MNRLFYPKLAASNIKKNFKMYFPYMLTCIFTVAMFYIIKSLSLNEGLENVMGAETAAYILELGSYVIGIFAFIFLFYTNSFLTKNRKKEFGLFNILGMEKRHIVRVIGFESLFVSLVSLIFGIAAGILLDKLMYAAILKLLDTKVALGFYISTDAIIHSLILFAVIFFVIFLNSVRLIRMSKPIELLSGSKMGEKEPKAKWFITLLGLICLGIGYNIALTTENPIAALSLFFVAVILVIIGTYLLFTAGSIAFLKILKSNKRYYYKTNHFISVSGMMYRMKQNAVGLANICILSTMVLVMVSSTTSLMVGIDDVVNERYPREINIAQSEGTLEMFSELKETVRKTAEEENIRTANEISYISLQFSTVYDGKDAFFISTNNDLQYLNDIYNIFIITSEDYSDYAGKEIVLAQDEVLLWSNRNKYENDHFKLFDKTFYIKQNIDDFIANPDIGADISPTLGLVVKDFDTLMYLHDTQKELYGGNYSRIKHTLCFDIDGDEADFAKTVSERIEKTAMDNYYFNVDSRELQRKDILGLYGSLFFLGIFLGLMFTVATVLIIYYKQISEGYDDKERFEIMQKVGLSISEVRSSIHSQVITVFFLPLITAGVHTAVAFPLVKKILAMFQLNNTGLFLACTIGVFAAFALIYALIYALTARVYYRIVKE